MQSIGRFTTRMTHLVEDGLSRADEAPLVDGAGSIGQLHRVANVEELAFVVHIGVVAVHFAIAAERVDDVLADGRGVAR